MHSLALVPWLPVLAAALLGACAQGTEIDPSEVVILPLTPADAPDASVDAGALITAVDTLQPGAPLAEPASAAAAPPTPEQVSVQPAEATPEPVSSESLPEAEADAGAEPEPAPEAPPVEQTADAAPPPDLTDAGSEPQPPSGG